MGGGKELLGIRFFKPGFPGSSASRNPGLKKESLSSKEEMHDGQRRLLIMTQVKIKLNAGDLPAAGKIYQKLKKLAPQSEETIAARELIKAAVIKGK